MLYFECRRPWKINVPGIHLRNRHRKSSEGANHFETPEEPGNPYADTSSRGVIQMPRDGVTGKEGPKSDSSHR